MSAAKLEFDGVAYRAGGVPILNGVDLSVEPGRVQGLLGPNGAGKTTLLRIATRVLRPAAGVVRIDGKPVDEFSRRDLARKVAIVPQDTSVPFPFSALEIVLMGRAPHQPLFGFETADDLAAARAAMERMGVLHLAERSVLEVSGGERQLVMLARALAQNPQILLLDEPTAFLDVRHRIAVLRAVRAFADAGGAALLVSHDLGLAARACDDLALLIEGRVGRRGAPAEVLSAEAVRATFGIGSQVIAAPDGSPLVVPDL